MAEYIDREELVRSIICSMGEFIGAPDDVQKHDEQCNYAINVIEDAIVVDVTPVVHGRWIHYPDCGVTRCSHCGWSIEECWESKRCPECGARMKNGC